MIPALLLQRMRALNHSDPAIWPVASQAGLCLAVMLAILLCGWLLHLAPALALLESGDQTLKAMKASLTAKQRQADMLPSLQEEETLLARTLGLLEEGLSAGEDLGVLLSDIGDAASQRRLQFEFARPGKAEIAEAFIAQPIQIRLGGNYHEVGRFAADLAAMPRMLILNNMQLTAGELPGTATLDAVVLAYSRRRPTEKTS